MTNKIKSCTIICITILIIISLSITIKSFASSEINTDEIDTISTTKDYIEEISDYVYIDINLSQCLQEHIQDECEKNNVEYALVLAMIDQESNFNIDCVSITNDYGLMQLHNRPDLLDPYLNTEYGINMIGNLIDKYGNYNDALMCYNCGEYGASQLWESGVYSTQYSKNILEKYDYYKSIL